MTVGTQGDLITAIVQKLSCNPSLLAEFASLYHGSYKPVSVTEVDGKPVIDTFLVETIISLNSFGCPLTSKQSHHSSTLARDTIHHSCGVWPLASRINHSCTSNARRSFIGDLQIARATRSLPADTELTFWYQSPVPLDDVSALQKKLANWAFQCSCAICIDTASTPKKTLRKRKDLLGDLKATFAATPDFNIDTAKAERLLTAVSKTYKHPPAAIPRLALRDPYAHLALLYSNQRNAEKSVSMAFRALESLGFVIVNGELLPSVAEEKVFVVERWGIVTDDVVGLFVHLMNAYTAFAPWRLETAVGYAKIAYKICVGDEGGFADAYHWEGEVGVGYG